MAENKIDFVVTWVNGNDPEWIAEKAKYDPKMKDNSATANRFRDWELMKYWFRGVEKFAPWVNNVYFITCGHYPEWLNLKNPKLRFVKHTDYIPRELLPTFNGNVIEMHINRIKDLEERFVLFNDDIFLIADTVAEDFFKDDKPCETALLGAISPTDYADIFPHILVNNSAIINKHFIKKEVLKKCKKQFFSLRYGREGIRNILLKPFVYFSDFRNPHLAVSHLKSNFDELWEKEHEAMYNGSKSRFRSKDDLNHWLFQDWNICKGNIVPRSPKFGKKFELGEDKGVIEYIIQQKGKMICVNDSSDKFDFEKTKIELHDAFEKILPDKSSFEA